ncbi:SGNH/GDSL hydrolase family protein [Pseudoclavibacter sp. VKM Ac-2867]|uniref:SGNH/GDSL hydrolase family protein n=1 Tax=Pseudoclavibacter sp. VKM Ac-2867 TaxID=2783829 RepID=UPI00188C621A|nr:SGNH/GDSL hydrolase family protein [Pseudoclavibacter sp. VKM Ac-2867]MBF4459493.1 SGNH/GDSL hydrolase family protein [Pseudoclavibacter sp. VKM Ac-2867]
MHTQARPRVTHLSVTATLAAALLLSAGGNPAMAFTGSAATPAPTATAETTPAPASVEATLEPTQVEATPESTATELGSSAPTAEPEATVGPLIDVVDADHARSATAGAAKTLQCYGDSMISYLCGDEFNAMRKTIPDWTVLNNAEGGMTSPAIATAAGVHTLSLSLSRSITIPSSGTVLLGQPNGIPVPLDQFGRLVYDASIGGVAGKLTHRPDLSDPNVQWSFKRASSGNAVKVGAGTQILSLDKPIAGAPSVFWVGTNNLARPEQVKNDIKNMVALHTKTSNAPYYVVTIPPAWEGFNTTTTNNRLAINAWIEQTYGQRTIPLSDYLSNGALYDGGFTPTSADRSDIAAGFNPRALWRSATDKTHLSEEGHLLASRYIVSFVTGGNTLAKAEARFGVQSTANVAVSGSRVTVSGTAFDFSDLLTSIPVGITVDGKWNATMASGASTHLYQYGIPGSHAYSMTFTLNPGQHLICTVGVNFRAGNDSFPPCQWVSVPKSAAPIGQVMDAPASNGMHQFAGWSYAPSSPSRSIPVAILVDGKWHHAVNTDRPTPYLTRVPGKHAFWTAASFSKGNHSMCAVAIESDTNMTNLGCMNFTIK